MDVQSDWRHVLTFRCTGCGNCCRGTCVVVTDADVRRIVRGTGRALREFVRFVGPDDVALGARSGLWADLGGRRAVMALRWTRRRCVFLGADERCTIYEHRPTGCRQFPFEVTLGDDDAIADASLSRIVECPHAWDGRVGARALTRVVHASESENAAYVERVQAWNRARIGRRSTAAFLRFLGLAEARETARTR
ncbi:MAG TPA: YkgJ family cysteine cluster protein [Candidatus Binatia bacterium]